MTTELEKARKRWKWRIRCERRVEGSDRKMRREKVKRKGSRRKKDRLAVLDFTTPLLLLVF